MRLQTRWLLKDARALLHSSWGRAAVCCHSQGWNLHGYKLPEVHVTCVMQSSGRHTLCPCLTAAIQA